MGWIGQRKWIRHRNTHKPRRIITRTVIEGNAEERKGESKTDVVLDDDRWMWNTLKKGQTAREMVTSDVSTCLRGPSIYEVHTEGEGSSSEGHTVQHTKLEPTYVILSSSHAKKLALLYKNFTFGWIRKRNFVVDIIQ